MTTPFDKDLGDVLAGIKSSKSALPKADKVAPTAPSVSLPTKRLVLLLGIALVIGGFSGSLFSYAVLYPVIKNAGGNGSTQQITQQVTVEEGSGVIDAVKKIAPSVVSITTTTKVLSFFGGIAEQKGGGTGVVLTSDGLILTNKHVIEAANTLRVITSTGEDYEAEVVAVDPLFDFAIVKIDARDLTVAELGDSDSLEIGQRVIAIGNALGEYQNSVTVGVISARARAITASDGSGGASRLEGLIQTDAPISPGNSGGPLINIRGQVIGVNTAVDAQGNSIGFAIPISSAKVAFNSYKKFGKIVRPYIGIRYVNITRDFANLNDLGVTHGALITTSGDSSVVAVAPRSPAAQAGLKEGDIILTINGDEVTESRGIITILSPYAPGDKVEVKYLRDGKEATVSLTLGELK